MLPADDQQPLASSSRLMPILDLPPLQSLQAWVHRPQAIARCFISDVYSLRSLQMEGQDVTYGSRDIFLLKQFPCKMVQMAGWVAGVDDKESKLDITLDDGDGQNVLPIIVKLPTVLPTTSRQLQTKITSKGSKDRDGMTNDRFASAKERAFLKGSLGRMGHLSGVSSVSSPFPKGKIYERKDIRVGDTVLVVGRVDEWFRRRSDGGGDWIRQVIVEQGGGGSITVVDPRAQFDHVQTVLHLHQTVYSQKFSIPLVIPPSIPGPSKNDQSYQSSPGKRRTRLGSCESTLLPMASSELTSEVGYEDEAELRDPSLLSSSQLTDHTFRRYLMDYMTRQTRATLERLAQKTGDQAVNTVLERLFPEFGKLVRTPSHRTSLNGSRWTALSGREHEGKGRDDDRVLTEIVFRPSTRCNFSTPTNYDAKPSYFNVSKTNEAASTSAFSSSPSSPSSPSAPSASQSRDNDGPTIIYHTLPSLLIVHHLVQLAKLVIMKTARRSEKARRDRLKAGTGTIKDRLIEEERLRLGRGRGEWRLDDVEVTERVARLFEWGIRCASEDGEIVQISLPVHHSVDHHGSNGPLDSDVTPRATRSTSTSTSSFRKQRPTSPPPSLPPSTSTSSSSLIPAYIPLPPQLLLPLITPLIERETSRRRRIFIPKTDERYGNGMLLPQLLGEVRGWGEEGRWERVGEFCLEGAVEFGLRSGVLKRVGKGLEVSQGSEL